MLTFWENLAREPPCRDKMIQRSLEHAIICLNAAPKMLEGRCGRCCMRPKEFLRNCGPGFDPALSVLSSRVHFASPLVQTVSGFIGAPSAERPGMSRAVHRVGSMPWLDGALRNRLWC
jgi:hypothetical protein